jgi:hypothetical protein
MSPALAVLCPESLGCLFCFLFPTIKRETRAFDFCHPPAAKRVGWWEVLFFGFRLSSVFLEKLGMGKGRAMAPCLGSWYGWPALAVPCAPATAAASSGSSQ